jgi:FMN reductase
MIDLVAVNASPSFPSRTRAIAELAVNLAGGRLLDLTSIDAEALLLRRRHPSLDLALKAVAAARTVLLATPVYRATYSGILKTFLDALPQAGLAGKACVLVATGGSQAHFLSLDTGLRAVVASVKGCSAPTVVYASPEDFDAHGRPRARVRATLEEALGEARSVSRALATAPASASGGAKGQ